MHCYRFPFIYYRLFSFSHFQLPRRSTPGCFFNSLSMRDRATVYSTVFSPCPAPAIESEILSYAHRCRCFLYLPPSRMVGFRFVARSFPRRPVARYLIKKKKPKRSPRLIKKDLLNNKQPTLFILVLR